MNVSFDLSSVDELQPLAKRVRLLTESGAEPLIIGAIARDLVLRYVHGLPIRRLTVDLDVAVPMASWNDFAMLRDRLAGRGAIPDPRTPHRVWFNEWQIDIVPFGGVAVNGVISWPPDDEVEMTIFGLAEARRHALEVVLPSDTVAAVASLPALLLMKVLTWSERHRKLDDRDARDIRALLDGYAAEWNQDRLYEEADDLLAHFVFDIELAAAALLGRDAAAIAEEATARRIREILERETSPDALRLASDMGGRADDNLQLLRALRGGFQSV